MLVCSLQLEIHLNEVFIDGEKKAVLSGSDDFIHERVNSANHMGSDLFSCGLKSDQRQI